MTENAQIDSPRRLRPMFREQFYRLIACVIAIILVALLLTAGLLEPNPEGLGTHQQLGFPPCTSRVLFGVRCPSCGMTTSWSFFARGQWLNSVMTNVGGFLLAIAASATALIAIMYAIHPAKVKLAAFQRHAAFAAVAVLAVTLADWVWRLLP